MLPSSELLTPPESPFQQLGGEARVRAIVTSFYRAMAEREPALAKLHQCDEAGQVSAATQERFALFFMGWLGGPADYVAQYGHPRLRMRHAQVPVNNPMIEAWLRCMGVALDQQGVTGEIRAFLERKLTDLARFLRNQPD